MKDQDDERMDEESTTFIRKTDEGAIDISGRQKEQEKPSISIFSSNVCLFLI